METLKDYEPKWWKNTNKEEKKKLKEKWKHEALETSIKTKTGEIEGRKFDYIDDNDYAIQWSGGMLGLRLPKDIMDLFIKTIQELKQYDEFREVIYSYNDGNKTYRFICILNKYLEPYGWHKSVIDTDKEFQIMVSDELLDVLAKNDGCGNYEYGRISFIADKETYPYCVDNKLYKILGGSKSPYTDWGKYEKHNPAVAGRRLRRIVKNAK